MLLFVSSRLPSLNTKKMELKPSQFARFLITIHLFASSCLPSMNTKMKSEIEAFPICLFFYTKHLTKGEENVSYLVYAKDELFVTFWTLFELMLNHLLRHHHRSHYLFHHFSHRIMACCYSNLLHLLYSAMSMHVLVRLHRRKDVLCYYLYQEFQYLLGTKNFDVLSRSLKLIDCIPLFILQDRLESLVLYN